MKTQKELKEKYNDILKEVWQDEHMQKYCSKKCDWIIELSDGNMVVVDKPAIQKDFCFGMGMYATYTDEEMDIAESLADKARNDVQYFKDCNLQQFTNKIKELNDAKSGKKECYSFVAYSGQSAESPLVSYNVVNIGDNPKYSPYRWDSLKAVKRLSDSDLDALIVGLEEATKRFEKRLNTYLKKYGLSALNVWTYCRD